MKWTAHVKAWDTLMKGQIHKSRLKNHRHGDVSNLWSSRNFSCSFFFLQSLVSEEGASIEATVSMFAIIAAGTSTACYGIWLFLNRYLYKCLDFLGLISTFCSFLPSGEKDSDTSSSTFSDTSIETVSVSDVLGLVLLLLLLVQIHLQWILCRFA